MADAMIQYEATDGQTVKLTPGIVAKYIVSGGGKVSDKELFGFMMKCQSRGLNPIAGDAYLVAYGGQASVIVSKDYFMRTAQQQKTFRGFKAGVVVATKHGLEYRDGTLCGTQQEQLVGGWAEIHDTRFEVPLKTSVSLSEYNTGKSLWKTKPATMIRKVALVQALREAYPQSYGGIYDADEMPEQYSKGPAATVAAEAEVYETAPAEPVSEPQTQPQEPTQAEQAPEDYYTPDDGYEATDIEF